MVVVRSHVRREPGKETDQEGPEERKGVTPTACWVSRRPPSIAATTGEHTSLPNKGYGCDQGRYRLCAQRVCTVHHTYSGPHLSRRSRIGSTGPFFSLPLSSITQPHRTA
jgi:hypothetical protein